LVRYFIKFFFENPNNLMAVIKHNLSGVLEKKIDTENNSNADENVSQKCQQCQHMNVLLAPNDYGRTLCGEMVARRGGGKKECGAYAIAVALRASLPQQPPPEALQLSTADTYFLEEIWRGYGHKDAHLWLKQQQEIKKDRNSDTASTHSWDSYASSVMSLASEPSGISEVSVASAESTVSARSRVHAAQDRAREGKIAALHPILQQVVDGGAPPSQAAVTRTSLLTPSTQSTCTATNGANSAVVVQSSGHEVSLKDELGRDCGMNMPQDMTQGDIDRSGLMYTDAAHLVRDQPRTQTF